MRILASVGTALGKGSLGQAIAATAVSVLMATAAQAAVVTVPQSSLVPTTQLYTDVIGGGIGNVVVMTGGGNAANEGQANGRNDDGFSGPIDFGFALPLFGQQYTQFWANNNGNISFTGGISAFDPEGPIGATVPVISIWFGDVDTRHPDSGVMHLRTDIENQIIITWPDVGRYGEQGDLLNTFQMVVRGPDYDIPEGEGSIGFFWLGMPWEATDTSSTAAVGFGNGAGDAIVLEGTNQPGLNDAVAFHQIWFNANLTPVCGTPGGPACPSEQVSEPGMLPLLGFGLLGAVGFARRRRSMLSRAA
jgi:hypothetical protein